MKMTFNKVMQLVLMFYNLANRYADGIADGSAGKGCLIYTRDGTLCIRTGTSQDKTLDGSLEYETLTLNLTLIPDG